MIPLAIVIAVLELGTEVLRAFNNLSPAQREKIVDQLIADDQRRREVWAEVTGWITTQIGKVNFP